MKSGIELITAERQRQIENKGYDASHDEMETAFQLSGAAAMFVAEAMNKDAKDHTHYDGMGNIARFQIREYDSKKWNEHWPWDDHDGRDKADIKTCLIKAAALIVAEIDRINEFDYTTSISPQVSDAVAFQDWVTGSGWHLNPHCEENRWRHFDQINEKRIVVSDGITTSELYTLYKSLHPSPPADTVQGYSREQMWDIFKDGRYAEKYSKDFSADVKEEKIREYFNSKLPDLKSK